MPYVLGIADNLLIAGFDELGRYHDNFRQDTEDMQTA